MSDMIYYEMAKTEMERLGIEYYLYYLKICLINNLKENNKYISDKEIAKSFNYKSIIQYFVDVKKSEDIKFNIIDYKENLIDIHGVYSLLEKVLVDE